MSIAQVLPSGRRTARRIAAGEGPEPAFVPGARTVTHTQTCAYAHRVPHLQQRRDYVIAIELDTEDPGKAVTQVPEQLRPFVASRNDEEMLGVTETAARLGVSRTTVYDWANRHTLIAWRSTKRGLNVPAAQILGPGRVVPGLADVVEVVGGTELAWAFLSQEWPFDETVARPLERLTEGRLDEVLSAAAGFGTTFT